MPGSQDYEKSATLNAVADTLPQALATQPDPSQKQIALDIQNMLSAIVASASTLEEKIAQIEQVAVAHADAEDHLLKKLIQAATRQLHKQALANTKDTLEVMGKAVQKKAIREEAAAVAATDAAAAASSANGPGVSPIEKQELVERAALLEQPIAPVTFRETPASVLDKYDVKIQPDGKPLSSVVTRMLQDYIKVYPLKTKPNNAQFFELRDNLGALENQFCELQHDLIHHFFEETKKMKIDAKQYQEKYLPGIYEMMDSSHVKAPKRDEDSEVLYNVYSFARACVYEATEAAKGIVEAAKERKTLRASQLESVNAKIAWLNKKINSSRSDIDQLEKIYSNRADKNTLEMNENVKKRIYYKSQVKMLRVQKTIFEKLSNNELITYEEYNFLLQRQSVLDVEISRDLLDMALLKVELDPGYDKIDAQIKQSLKLFTEKGLNSFLDVIEGKMQDLSALLKITTLEHIQKVNLIHLNMFMFKELVPSLCFLALRLHHDDEHLTVTYQDKLYSISGILTGDYSHENPFLKSIADRYAKSTEQFRISSEDTINALVADINTKISSYIDAPTVEKIDSLIKLMNEFTEIKAAFIETFGEQYLRNIRKFTIGTECADNASDAFRLMLASFKDVMLGVLEDNVYGVTDAQLLNNARGFKFLGDKIFIIRDSKEVERSYDKGVNQILTLTTAKRMMSVEKLRGLERVNVPTHLKKLMAANKSYSENIASVMGFPTIDQAVLMRMSLLRLTENKELDANLNLEQAIAHILKDEHCPAGLSPLYFWLFNDMDADTLDLTVLLTDPLVDTELTHDQMNAIEMLLAYKPGIQSINFGRFVPDDTRINNLINTNEQIVTYIFNSEVISLLKRINQTEDPSLNVYFYRIDDKKNKVQYARSRIKPSPSLIKALLDGDKQDASSRTVQFKEKVIDGFYKMKEKMPKQSPPPVSQYTQLALMQDSIYAHLAANHMDPMKTYHALEFIDSEHTQNVSFNDFSRQMLFFKAKYHLSESFSMGMLKLSMRMLPPVEKVDDAIVLIDKWLKDLKNTPESYIEAASQLLTQIPAPYLSNCMSIFDSYSETAFKFYHVIGMSEHEAVLMRYLELGDSVDLNVFQRLLKAYLHSANLRDDFGSVQVLEDFYGLIGKIFQKGDKIKAAAIHVLVDQYVFAADISVNTLTAIRASNVGDAAARLDALLPEIMLINRALVDKTISLFERPIEGDNYIQSVKHYMSLMMSHDVMGSEDAFIHALGHYIANHYHDYNFEQNLKRYIDFIQNKKIDINTQRALKLFPLINALHTTKLRAGQYQFVRLIKLHLRSTEIFSSGNTVDPDRAALAEHFKVLDRRAHDAKIASLQSQIVDEDDSDYDIVNDLNHTPQDLTIKYFDSKLRSAKDIDWGKQAKKLTFIVELLDSLSVDDGRSVLVKYLDCIESIQGINKFFVFPGFSQLKIIECLNNLYEEQGEQLENDMDARDRFKDALTRLYDDFMRKIVKQYIQANTLDGIDDVIVLLREISTVNRSMKGWASDAYQQISHQHPMPTLTAPTPIEALVKHLSPQIILYTKTTTANDLIKQLEGVKTDHRKTQEAAAKQAQAAECAANSGAGSSSTWSFLSFWSSSSDSPLPAAQNTPDSPQPAEPGNSPNRPG